MKRFLQGFSGAASPYVGKTYRFGRLECVVEEQIAEGNGWIFCFFPCRKFSLYGVVYRQRQYRTRSLCYIGDFGIIWLDIQMRC